MDVSKTSFHYSKCSLKIKFSRNRAVVEYFSFEPQFVGIYCKLNTSVLYFWGKGLKVLSITITAQFYLPLKWNPFIPSYQLKFESDESSD